jgi:hypothetical protein
MGDADRMEVAFDADARDLEVVLLAAQTQELRPLRVTKVPLCDRA